MSIFTQIKIGDLKSLLTAGDFNIDSYDLISKSAYEMIGIHGGKKNQVVSQDNVVKELERRWYGSLAGDPDYSVYNEAGYIADIWACWVCYSRNSVRVLSHPSSLITRSFQSEVREGATILDLGCGFGYTTIALSEMFPTAKIFGTNLEDSYQFKLAQALTKSSGVSIVPSYQSVGNVDVAFASEYFEHIETPIEHLDSIIKACSPEYFVIANAFNGMAIGHFNYYKHMSKTYTAKVMSRMFLKELRILGYEKVPSRIWNDRPSIWRRKSIPVVS